MVYTVENTWRELQEAGVETAVVTVGAIEQHGHHLPLGTDWIIGITCPEGVDGEGVSRYNGAREETRMVWEETKRERFQELRRQELERNLDDSERSELEGLIQELDDMEAAALAPAIERMRQQNARLQEEAERLAVQAQQLAELLREKEAYLARARRFAEELDAERLDLLNRFARIAGKPLREPEATTASSG